MRNLLILSLLLAAQPTLADRMTGERIRKEIVGNTMTGQMRPAPRFSEYYAPDGRIYGHNGDLAVTDGCWSVKDDEMCYTYVEQGPPRTFCWGLDRRGDTVVVVNKDGGIDGLAKLEPGNPQGWTSEKAWSCDIPTSALPFTPRHVAGR